MARCAGRCIGGTFTAAAALSQLGQLVLLVLLFL
jgi:hypothetical protein